MANQRAREPRPTSVSCIQLERINKTLLCSYLLGRALGGCSGMCGGGCVGVILPCYDVSD